jgi:hypothetical protein
MRLAITARMCIFECGWMGRAACYAAVIVGYFGLKS